MITLNEISVDQLGRALRDAAGSNLAHISGTILEGSGFETAVSDIPSSWKLKPAVDAWLADVSDAAITKAAVNLGDVTERMCDPLGASLLRDAGVNPFALLAIERLMHLATNKGHTVNCDLETMAHITLDEPGHDRTGREGRIDVVTIRLRRDIWWDGRALSIDEGALPASVVHSLEGRRLTEVVDLPGCADVVITKARPTLIGTWRLETDRRHAPCSWASALLPSFTKEAA